MSKSNSQYNFFNNKFKYSDKPFIGVDTETNTVFFSPKALKVLNFQQPFSNLSIQRTLGLIFVSTSFNFRQDWTTVVRNGIVCVTAPYFAQLTKTCYGLSGRVLFIAKPSHLEEWYQIEEAL